MYGGSKTCPCLAWAAEPVPEQRFVCFTTRCYSSMSGTLYYTMLPKLDILLLKAEHWSSWLVLCIKMDCSWISWVVRSCKAISGGSNAGQITNLSHLMHKIVLGLNYPSSRFMYVNAVLAKLRMSGRDSPLTTKADAKLGHIYISVAGAWTHSQV